MSMRKRVYRADSMRRMTDVKANDGDTAMALSDAYASLSMSSPSTEAASRDLFPFVRLPLESMLW